MAKVRTERQLFQALCRSSGRFVTITQRTYIRLLQSGGIATSRRQAAEFFDPVGRRLEKIGEMLRHTESGDEYHFSSTNALRWMASG